MSQRNERNGRNERTSAKVAAIAGRVLAKLRPDIKHARLYGYNGEWVTTITRADIRALAASCLTQTADKKAVR